MSLVGGCNNANAAAPGATRYRPWAQDAFLWLNNLSADAAAQRVATAGKCSGLSLRVRLNTLTTATITARSYVNGANGNQVISAIAAGATGLFQDTTNEDTVAAGDLVAVQFTVAAGGSGTATLGAWWGRFAASSGLATMVSTSLPDLTYDSNGETFTPVGQLWAITEASAQFNATTALTLSGLHAWVGANTYNQASAVNLRKNGANGTPSVSIPASTANARFVDASGAESIAADDLWCYGFAQTGGAGQTDVKRIGATLSGDWVPVYAASPASGGGGGWGRQGSTSPGYASILPMPTGSIGASGAADREARQVVLGYAAKARRLRCVVRLNTRTATTIALANGTTATALSLVIGAGATGTFENLTDVVDIAATDQLVYRMTGSGSNDLFFRWASFELQPVSTAKPVARSWIIA